MIPLDESEGRLRPPLSEFDVSDLRVGTKAILDYRIAQADDGTSWGLSILAIRGTQEGPVLLVNGGTHGDEYEGPWAIQELFESSDPSKIHGTWLGVPVLNEPAMSVPQRVGRYDNQDLARIFPGNATGTLTERIAFGFAHQVMKTADYYIDLHSGGNILRVMFMSGYKLVADTDVLAQQRKMAVAFGGDLVWGSPPILRPTLWQAEQFGIPAIYTETTGTGGANHDDVERYKEGVRNVMRLVGMLEGAYPTQPRRFFRETPSGGSNPEEGYFQIDHPAPCKGLFVPSVELSDMVKKGQQLGKIVDAAGRTLAPVLARRDGHVIMIRHWLSVNKNDPLLLVVPDLRITP